jgi:hypothetical protein
MERRRELMVRTLHFHLVIYFFLPKSVLFKEWGAFQREVLQRQILKAHSYLAAYHGR